MGHWIYIYSKLTNKDKTFLEKYYSSLYPRDYVRKLVAFFNKNTKESSCSRDKFINYVQLKESQC